MDMELYHVLNRGVDKRTIFYDTMDHARFVHNLYEFNDARPALNHGRAVGGMIDLRGQSFGAEPAQRTMLVDIHGWVLMKNHYHLLLSERVEKGFTKFIMKLNVGYAKYFNEKYKRKGTLFEGRTKKIHIADDGHFLHILHYIHLNPLDFLETARTWRERRIKNSVAALAHLDSYKWSSYRDYCGEKNFPSVITQELFGDMFCDYKSAIKGYLQDLEVDSIREFVLE